MKNKRVRKIISGLLVLLIPTGVIGCSGKPITETENAVETPEPEKYFPYKVKYQERHGQAILITDENFPGSLRVMLSDDLPESFFEEIDCKSSQECFEQVIQEILDSLEGKEITLFDTQEWVPRLCIIDTTKPVELVFGFCQKVEGETGGPHYSPAEQGVSYANVSYMVRPDGGLRFVTYHSPLCFKKIREGAGKYYVSGDLLWLARLKFHPEIPLDLSKTQPWRPYSPEEENFYRKIRKLPEEGEGEMLGILMWKGG